MSNISLFWSGKLENEESFDEWRNKTIQLSYFYEATLDSHVKFNNKVRLYTYQNIDKNQIKIPR